MTMRITQLRCRKGIISLVFVALFTADVSADGQHTAPTLRIESAAATFRADVRTEAGLETRTNVLNVDCTAVVENNTGEPLRGLSTYRHPFSWMYLSVFDAQDKLLIRRSVVWHLSPAWAFAVPFSLPAGRATNELRNPVLDVPIDQISKAGGIIKVRLDGIPPGKRQSITSNVVVVKPVPEPRVSRE